MTNFNYLGYTLQSPKPEPGHQSISYSKLCHNSSGQYCYSVKLSDYVAAGEISLKACCLIQRKWSFQQNKILTSFQQFELNQSETMVARVRTPVASTLVTGDGLIVLRLGRLRRGRSSFFRKIIP